jgi:hypothetical protein
VAPDPRGAIPAGPPPTTTTSNSPYTGVDRLGSMVCLASMCSTERMTVEVHALSAADSPLSVCSGGHGESSSFSAMQQEYLAGVPGWPDRARAAAARTR